MIGKEMSLGSSQFPNQNHRSAILLAWASGILIAGACAGVLQLGAAFQVPLCMVLFAIALGITAVARSAAEEGFAYSVQSGTRRLWLIFAALLLIHGWLAFQFCKAMPGETIDTFTIQRDVCWTLVHGIDPYGTTHANIYNSYLTALFYGPGMVVDGRVQIGFPYPPLTILWALPGYLLGDVRYSYIFAVIVSAFFLFAIFPNQRGLRIASVLLLSPLTFWVENRCWTEPLVLMALSATVYAAVKKRCWLPLALGFFLATKQYNLLVLPFIGLLVRPFQWKAYWRLTGMSLAIGVATVLPFACWNFRALWHDLVQFHLAQPFRNDALSFAVPFPFMLKVGPVLVVAFIAWVLRTGKRNAAIFAAGYGMSLLLFFSTSKQAFANYYFLVAQAILLAVAVLCGIQSDPMALANTEKNNPGASAAPMSASG